MKKGALLFSLVLIFIIFASLSFVSSLPGLGGDCSNGQGCDPGPTICWDRWHLSCNTPCGGSVCCGWGNGGYCTSPPCVGSCLGKQCGDDGCRRSCGTCSSDATCTNFQCIPNTKINTSYWTNLNGNLIDKAHLGDMVRMVVGGYGFNQDINYTIYKPSGFWFFKWSTPLSSTFSSDLWISNEIVNDVFFKAKIGSVENISSSINIISSNNKLPYANITFLQEEYATGINYPINFSQFSFDEDDLLMLNWSFGDNTPNQLIYNYSLVDKLSNSSLGNVIHNYSAPGKYFVTLTATEMVRNHAHTDSIRIQVFSPGINVVPIISQPKDGISIGNVRIVEFNASRSYVANCTKGTITPLSFRIGNLNCSYIHAPGTKSYSSNNYTITMNWTLTSEGTSEIIRRTGDFVLDYNSTVIFTELFETGGIHTAYFDMIYKSR